MVVHENHKDKEGGGIVSNPYGGHQYVDRILIIFSNFNFLKGIKMMLKHYLGMFKRLVNLHVLEGALIVHQKYLGAHVFQ